MLLGAEFRNEPSAIDLLADMQQIKAVFLVAFQQVEMVYVEPMTRTSSPSTECPLVTAQPPQLTAISCSQQVSAWSDNAADVDCDFARLMGFRTR